MLIESSYYEFSLNPGEAVSLARTAGWEVVCRSGRVWLTEELGGRDVWLKAGQRFRLSRPGRSVIEATSDGAGATLRMCLPHQPREVAAPRHGRAPAATAKRTIAVRSGAAQPLFLKPT